MDYGNGNKGYFMGHIRLWLRRINRILFQIKCIINWTERIWDLANVLPDKSNGVLFMQLIQLNQRVFEITQGDSFAKNHQGIKCWHISIKTLLLKCRCISRCGDSLHQQNGFVKQDAAALVAVLRDSPAILPLQVRPCALVFPHCVQRSFRAMLSFQCVPYGLLAVRQT